MLESDYAISLSSDNSYDMPSFMRLKKEYHFCCFFCSFTLIQILDEVEKDSVVKSALAAARQPAECAEVHIIYNSVCVYKSVCACVLCRVVRECPSAWGGGGGGFFFCGFH